MPQPAADAAAAAPAGGDGAAAQTAPQPAADPAAMRSQLAELNTELDAMQGETPLMRVCVDAQIVGEVISGWTGIPVGKMLKDEISTVLSPGIPPGQPRDRPEPRARNDQPAHPHRPRRPGRSRQAGRRLPAGRPQRRRQDRNRPGAFRPPLRRRAQPDHHQHVGVPGSPHGLHPEGLASRIRRLRRRRRAHRSRPPPAVFGGAAGRGRKGPSRRPGAVLPGLRQRPDGRRRRPRDRFQEHHHHPDLQRRHRQHDEAHRRSGDGADAGRPGQSPQAGAQQDLQARVPRPPGDHSVLSRSATKP